MLQLRKRSYRSRSITRHERVLWRSCERNEGSKRRKQGGRQAESDRTEVLTSSKWVSMWIRVRAFSRKTMSIPLGILYSLNRFSCMFASCANTNDECSKPTSTQKSNDIRSSRLVVFQTGGSASYPSKSSNSQSEWVLFTDCTVWKSYDNTYLTRVNTNRLWNEFHRLKSSTWLVLCQFLCLESLFRCLSGWEERMCSR